jgi:hypothetical protein
MDVYMHHLDLYIYMFSDCYAIGSNHTYLFYKAIRWHLEYAIVAASKPIHQHT